MPKLLDRTPWLGFKARLLHLFIKNKKSGCS